MNRLSNEDRAKILSMLCEGVGINAACRLSGASKMTVLKLLADAGQACSDHLDANLRNLTTKRVECDEIWSFVGSKAKNTTKAGKLEGKGDAWTWTAIDADSKLMVSYLVGGRDACCAMAFMEDVASRLANRVQLTYTTLDRVTCCAGSTAPCAKASTGNSLATSSAAASLLPVSQVCQSSGCSSTTVRLSCLSAGLPDSGLCMGF